MNDQIVHTTDAAFDTDVVKSPQPVLLDFWAEWCTPCKMIAPILDVIADEYKGRLRVVKLNIDENPKTPTQYDVRSIPTLLMFKDGKVVGQIVGAVPKPKIEDLIKKAL